MEKLRLEDLAPYLPYGLECEISGTLSSVEIRKATGFKLNHLSYINKFVYQVYFGTYGYEFKDIKPILKLLSDLTRDELHELGCILSDHTYWGRDARIDWAKKWLSDKGCRQSNLKWSKNAIEYLYSLHIDLNGLIEKGLAIDIKTVKL